MPLQPINKEKVKDERDSRAIPQITIQQNGTPIDEDKTDSWVIDPKIEWEKEHYDLNYKYLAKYFIFNHYKFDDKNLSPRNGTAEDVKTLKNAFQKLNCKKGENTFEDLTARQVKAELKKAAQGDYRDYAAVIVVVLTHGEEGILYAKDKEYNLKEFWEPFLSNDASPDLIGKPKIFFIQACQGVEADPGKEKIEIDARIDNSRTINIPQYADFLFLFSSPPGNCAFRSEKGSWMIQTLCEGLRDHCDNLDFQSVILLTKNYIARHKESYSPNNAKFNKKKQMPYEVSTLTKKFYLTQKCLEKYPTWNTEPKTPNYLRTNGIDDRMRKNSRDGPNHNFDQPKIEPNPTQEIPNNNMHDANRQQNLMFVYGMAMMASCFVAVFLAIVAAQKFTN